MLMKKGTFTERWYGSSSEGEKTMTTWWVSCVRFTCLVQVKGNKIVGGAPIIKKWIGRSFEDFLVNCEIDRMCLMR